MPYIHVSVSGKSDHVLSAKIAQTITELTREHLQKDPAVTAVAMTFVGHENWYIGGQSLASLKTNSFWLDIKVTQGTNTKVQMAAYLEAVFGEMKTLLTPVHEDSYILVHEVLATSWGFAGKTQEYRFIAGRMMPTA